MCILHWHSRLYPLVIQQCCSKSTTVNNGDMSKLVCLKHPLMTSSEQQKYAHVIRLVRGIEISLGYFAMLCEVLGQLLPEMGRHTCTAPHRSTLHIRSAVHEGAQRYC